MKTRLCACLLVLVLCCSSAFAFVPLKGFSKPSAEPAQESPVEESKKTSKNSTETTIVSETLSTNSDVVDAMNLEELKEYLDGKFIVTPKQIEEINKAVDKVGTDIDKLKADLNKEKNGSKFMADVGMLFNFSEGVRFGALANVGCRLGSGLLLKVGAETMVGGVTETKGFHMEMPALSDVNLTCSIGWEW